MKLLDGRVLHTGPLTLSLIFFSHRKLCFLMCRPRDNHGIYRYNVSTLDRSPESCVPWSPAPHGIEDTLGSKSQALSQELVQSEERKWTVPQAGGTRTIRLYVVFYEITVCSVVFLFLFSFYCCLFFFIYCLLQLYLFWSYYIFRELTQSWELNKKTNSCTKNKYNAQTWRHIVSYKKM